MTFERYSEDAYEAVCDFLIELKRADRSHINWNWARFEWMYEHPGRHDCALFPVENHAGIA